MWEPADLSSTTGKIRTALIWHLAGRFDEAVDIYEAALASQPRPNAATLALLEEWRDMALTHQPLKKSAQRCIQRHFNDVRAAHGLPPVSLRATPPRPRVSRLAATLTEQARMDTPPGRPGLRLVAGG